jgi:hypothetical protein
MRSSRTTRARRLPPGTSWRRIRLSLSCRPQARLWLDFHRLACSRRHHEPLGCLEDCRLATYTVHGTFYDRKPSHRRRIPPVCCGGAAVLGRWTKWSTPLPRAPCSGSNPFQALEGLYSRLKPTFAVFWLPGPLHFSIWAGSAAEVSPCYRPRMDIRAG